MSIVSVFNAKVKVTAVAILFCLGSGLCCIHASEICALRELQKRIMDQARRDSADYVVFRGEIGSLPPPRDPRAPVLTLPVIYFDYAVEEVLWGHVDGTALRTPYISEAPCGRPELVLHAKVITYCSLNSSSAGYCSNPVTASEENLAKVRSWIHEATLRRQKVWLSPETAEGMLVDKVPPVYPPLGNQAHVEGDVVLRIVIDTQGRVERAQAIKGHPILIPSAIDAVRQWRYKPYVVNGRSLRVETTVTVPFRLEKPSGG